MRTRAGVLNGQWSSTFIIAMIAIGVGICISQPVCACYTEIVSGSYYADTVSASGICVNSNEQCNPNEAEGAPDDDVVSLGGEGYIIAVLEEPVVDGPGDDLRVYEDGDTTGGTNEGFDVYVSTNGTSWTKIASCVMNDSGKNYASLSLSGRTGVYTHVKIVDCWTDPYMWEYTGADIDAIEGLHTQVEIIDSEAPIISCPADQIVESGSSTSPVATGQATAVDDYDPSPSVSYSDSAAGSCPQIITRTWRAEDECGNASTCVQVITVENSSDQDCDGLVDAIDPCPSRSDCDGDGVGDKTDDCPEVAGSRSNDGCPEESVISEALLSMLWEQTSNVLCSSGPSMASDWIADIPLSSTLRAWQAADCYRIEGKLDGDECKLLLDSEHGLRLTSMCEIVMEVQIRELEGAVSLSVLESQYGGMWSLSLTTEGASFTYERPASTAEKANLAMQSVSGTSVLRLIFDYGHLMASAYMNDTLVGEMAMPQKVGTGEVHVSLAPDDDEEASVSLDLVALCIGAR